MQTVESIIKSQSFQDTFFEKNILIHAYNLFTFFQLQWQDRTYSSGI